MPLRKRILYDPAAYHRKDVFEESSADTYLQDHNMSKMLGAMNQIAYLSTFALEVMQNLAILTEDLSERIKVASARTNDLYGNLKSVDRQVASIDDNSHVAAIPGMPKYLQSREMFTPQLFNKTTNYSSISLQYRICRSPPQLWRIEVFTDEDCFRNYSNPGFFFQEWIRAEITRQRRGKEEKKRNKALKKAQRQERKKLKELAEAEAAENENENDEYFHTMYSSPSISAGASANVSLSGVTGDKRNKSMLRYNKEHEDRFSEALAAATLQEEENPFAPHTDPDHSNWMNESDPPVEEEEQSEEDVQAAAASTKESKSSKGKSAKSKLRGLTKLFKSKKNKKSGEESTDDESPTAAGAAPRPSFSKTDSMSMQLLNVQIQGQAQGKSATSSKSKRGMSGRTTAPASSGDSGAEQEVSEDEHHRHQHQREGHKSVTAPAAASSRAPRPMSYVDELSAGAANTRRMSLLHNNNMHSHSIHNNYTNTHTHTDVSAAAEHPQGAFAAETEEKDAELDLSGLNLSMKVPKKSAKAPVTMKIGNKFLSATVAGKAATTSNAYNSAVNSAEVVAEPHRRGSRVNLVHSVLPEHDDTGAGAGVGGANWESQRMSSRGNLLVKPPPPPSGSADRPVSNKRASFSEDHGHTHSQNMLLSRGRQSFIAAAAPSAGAGGFGSGGRGRWDSEDSGGGTRKKSLLSMLQEEVLQSSPDYHQQEQYDGEGDDELPAEDYVRDTAGNDEEGSAGEPEEGLIDELDMDVGEYNNNNDGDEDGEEPQEDPPSDIEEGDEGPGSPPPGDDEGSGPEDEDAPVSRGRSPASPVVSPPTGGRKAAPPPPPPPPAPVLRSPLGDSILGSLKAGATLKKVDPPPEPKIDERTHLLRSIQLGSVQLKSAGAGAAKAKPFQKIDVKQNEAVAAILANRSKIAGSDTESSDDSDSDYTDDDY